MGLQKSPVRQVLSKMAQFNSKLGLTFDDVLLLPDFSEIKREEIDLKIDLTPKVKLNLPLISSPMDTVTEYQMAQALAKIGGLGIIHRNLSINEQSDQIGKVKKTAFDQKKYPGASVDKKGRLLVGAAVGPGKDLSERAERLVSFGVDLLVVDSAHGFSLPILEATRLLKKNFPQLPVMAGNVATYDGAKALIEAGADILRVGMGPGSICTTRVISGVGVPQITAITEAVRAAKRKNIPVVADGGIRYSGDITKALAAGALSVMLGSLLAACPEAPGKIIFLTKEHVPHRFLSIFNSNRKVVQFKEYRGMGSVAAMKKGGATRYGQENYKRKALIAEGVESLVPIKETVEEIAEQLMGGLRSGMYYIGAQNIKELWQKAEFIQITTASMTESHPHDILIVNPGNNYDSRS